MENNMRVLMAKRNLNVVQLSKLCGVSRNSLGRILSGRQKPKADTVIKICEALDCSYDDFFIKEG